MFSLALLSALATSVFAQDVVEYNVVNNCPASLNLYINGERDSTINSGSSELKILGPSITSFYTDLNGGNANGSLSTRANFNAAVNIEPINCHIGPQR